MHLTIRLCCYAVIGLEIGGRIAYPDPGLEIRSHTKNPLVFKLVFKAQKKRFARPNKTINIAPDISKK